MTTLVLPVTLDAWVNEAPNRVTQNYGDTDYVQSMAGTGARRRIFLRPNLGNIAGRLVVDAYLTGHVGKGGNLASSVTVTPVTERWQPGRVKWSNQPGVNTTGQVTTSLPAASQGALVTLPGMASLVQAVADGTEYFGFRITSSTTTPLVFAASDSGLPAFEMVIILSELTDAPSDLTPDGGAVSTSQPVLSWTFDDQVSRTVQVDTPAAGAEPDEVSPDYSNTASTTSTELALASIPRTLVGAGPHYFRVRATADGAVEPSEWSEWAEFTVAALPSLVVDSPTGPFGDPSPTVLAHLSSGTLDYWRVQVTGPSRSDVRADSGVMSGPIAYQVPERSGGRQVVQDGGWFYVEAHDTTDRVPAVGAPDFASAWVPIVLGDSGSVQVPSSLSVTQVEPGDPRHDWVVQRSEAPDALLFGQDDRVLAKVDLADLTVSGGTYSWRDNGEVQPLRPHNLWVKAVDDDATSAKRQTPVRSHTVEGVWLLPVGGDPIVVDGTEVGGFIETDRRATFEPLTGPPLDVIYDTNPGRTGNFEGSISTAHGADVWGTQDRLKALRASPTRLVRMVWGSQSMLVRITDPDFTSAPSILPSTLEHVVRFGFVQVGD